MINAIVCVDNNWAIGKNNGLLFNIKADMKYFRETTKNTVVCMGENTLLSLPGSKPLKNRVNVVANRQEIKEIKKNQVSWKNTIDKCKKKIKVFSNRKG